MHDPDTLAFDLFLPLPWKRWKSKTRGLSSYARIPLLTIWHHDPQRDGTDDYCAVRKRLARRHHSLIESWGDDEGRDPWFQAERARSTRRPADAECLLRGALWHVTRCFRLHSWSLFHRRVTFDDCSRLAAEMLHNPIDNLRSALCLLPGWHTNEAMPGTDLHEEIPLDDDEGWKREKARPLSDYPAEATAHWRSDCGKRFFYTIARILSSESARWWHRPKWHFWHWRIQWTLYQRIKRRWWERCDMCRERFRGASVYSDWHGTRKWCGNCRGVSQKPPAMEMLRK